MAAPRLSVVGSSHESPGPRGRCLCAAEGPSPRRRLAGLARSARRAAGSTRNCRTGSAVVKGRDLALAAVCRVAAKMSAEMMVMMSVGKMSVIAGPFSRPWCEPLRPLGDPPSSHRIRIRQQDHERRPPIERCQFGAVLRCRPPPKRCHRIAVAVPPHCWIADSACPTTDVAERATQQAVTSTNPAPRSSVSRSSTFAPKTSTGSTRCCWSSRDPRRRRTAALGREFQLADGR